MKYSIIKFLYPNDSATKLKRRHTIILRTVKHLDYNDLMTMNYTNISHRTNTDRRTLYNYFPTKDEFLLAIALAILEGLFLITEEKIRNISIVNKSSSKYLYDLLFICSDSVEFYKFNSIMFFKQFENFFYRIERESKLYERYISGANYVKEKYSLLEEELYRLYDEGIIVNGYVTDREDTIFTLKESIFAFQLRLVYMQHEHDGKHRDILTNFINIQVNAFTTRDKYDIE